MSSCAASCCTCSRKVSCASATSASWPTANVPPPCHFPSNCSAGHRKTTKRPPPPVSLKESGKGVARLRLADRKSTPLNPSHQIISYAVLCLEKKNNDKSRP